MTNILLYLLLGVLAGFLSGLVGIGGGVLIVPVLVFWFGLSQHEAQGTTLALLVPPIGLLGALTYYRPLAKVSNAWLPTSLM
ncbi:MAG: TSUP family transporter [Nostoc sp.]|uniref:TSUP family transporter n=1 Tax=Nostoc sp. TaxID=1180 RepID=UPI002FF6543D